MWEALDSLRNPSPSSAKSGMPPRSHTRLGWLLLLITPSASSALIKDAPVCNPQTTQLLHPSMPPAQKQVLLVWWFTAQVGPHSVQLICLLLQSQGRVPANCSPAVRGVMLLSGGRTTAPSAMYECKLLSCRWQPYSLRYTHPWLHSSGRPDHLKELKLKSFTLFHISPADTE